MNRSFAVLSTGVLLLAGLVQAADKPVEMPTEAQIKAFSATHKGTDKEYVLEANFALARLYPAALRQYAQAGKVPFRVTIAVFEKVMNGGDPSYYGVMDGVGNIVIVDENNNPVVSKALDLDLLCPS